MKTLKYFTSQTLRNFQQFQELLVSDEPLGMETFKAQSGVVAMTFNHNLELLIAEKEEQFSSFLGVQIDKSKMLKAQKTRYSMRYSTKTSHSTVSCFTDIF